MLLDNIDALNENIDRLTARVEELIAQISAAHRIDLDTGEIGPAGARSVIERLDEIPGIGPRTAAQEGVGLGRRGGRFAENPFADPLAAK